MSETPSTPKRSRKPKAQSEAPAEAKVEQTQAEEQPTEAAPLTPEQDPKVDAEQAAEESSETGQDAPVQDTAPEGAAEANEGSSGTSEVPQARQHEETIVEPAEGSDPTVQPEGAPIRDVPNTVTEQRATIEREAPAAAAETTTEERHLEAPATPVDIHGEDAVRGELAPPVAVVTARQVFDRGTDVPEAAAQERIELGQIDPGDQHAASTIVTEADAAAGRNATLIDTAGAAQVRTGTLPAAAAAPLEAPSKPQSFSIPADHGGLDKFAVAAAKQRRSVILDSETGEAPEVEGLLEAEEGRSHSYVVTRRLVQTQFFGVHSQPSKVLAFAAGRVLTTAQAESLKELLAAQRSAVEAGADTSRPLDTNTI